MKAYYNEIEPTAILWLQAAMDAGIITQGDIDTRPIQEVTPDDVKGYTRCHYFAGIGGWDIALKLAGWPDDRFIWTGSCPCQPFSSAGRQKGKADERHLWPIWYGLIRESKPTVLFGEQVSGAIAHGWLDDVYQGLEEEGYAVGSAVLPACSVGKAHRRERLWFVADRDTRRCDALTSSEQYSQKYNPEPRGAVGNAERRGDGDEGCGKNASQKAIVSREARQQRVWNESSESSQLGDVADTGSKRQPGQGEMGQSMYPAPHDDGQANRANDDSAGIEWLPCPDGKARPIKSGLPLLVNGLPGKLRKAALHGYGNAIVPGLAAEFIKAYMEART